MFCCKCSDWIGNASFFLYLWLDSDYCGEKNIQYSPWDKLKNSIAIQSIWFKVEVHSTTTKKNDGCTVTSVTQRERKKLLGYACAQARAHERRETQKVLWIMVGFFMDYHLQRASWNCGLPVLRNAFYRILNSCNFSHYRIYYLLSICNEQQKKIHCNLFPFLIFFSSPFHSFVFLVRYFFLLLSINFFHTLLCCWNTYGSDYTGGPLGLFIIFPEPIFGPPFAASNCDIKRRTIGWTSNANRIHVQRRSKCTILSAFCSVKNSRIVEGK